MVAMLPPLYAHRLGRGYGPDSSAAALQGALAAGVDGLETDLCLTADGELALLHDPYLPLATDLEGFVHERTAAELRRARLRDAAGRTTSEAPLFLDDLLAAAPPDLTLQLEIKAHADPALALRTLQATAERLQGERPRRDGPAVADRLRGRRPARPGLRSVGAARARVRRPEIELLSFSADVCARAARLGWPARLVVWADYAPATLARWARRHGVAGVCVEHFLLSAPLADALRAGGLSLSTGTINEPALLDRVLRFRPDAVTSDRPDALRQPAAALSLAA